MSQFRKVRVELLASQKQLCMKDLNGLTCSFQEWSAVLDFLVGVKHAKDIQDVHITKEDGKGWTMKIMGTPDEVGVNGNHKRKTPGVALYDLYW